MKILEPVDQAEIPRVNTRGGITSKYQELYDRVLSLNGKALPVEFEDMASAHRMAQVWQRKANICYKQGIRVIVRDKVLYLSKRSP